MNKEESLDLRENYVPWANTLDSAGKDSTEVQARLQDHNVVMILHAAMGLTTEGGELMDALKCFLFYGKPIDKANILEESGDLLWYMALIAKWLGYTNFDQIMWVNRDKLTLRYGDTWSQDGALNRDLDAEKQLLDAGAEESKFQIRDLTQDENNLLAQQTCPFCRNRHFLKGPEGGMSINIKCSECEAKFNYMGGSLTSELIGPPTKQILSELVDQTNLIFRGETGDRSHDEIPCVGHPEERRMNFSSDDSYNEALKVLTQYFKAAVFTEGKLPKSFRLEIDYDR